MTEFEILNTMSLIISFIVGMTILPLLLITYIVGLKFYKAHRSRKIDEKRRKTFKVVQGSKTK